MSIMDRLKKVSTIEETNVITKSNIYGKETSYDTGIPMLNVALSGRVDGGLTSGVTIVAGPSKHFKTLFMFVMMRAFLDANEEATAILYDSEFGSNLSYLEFIGIDPERVLHVPIANIEELRIEVMKHLDEIKRGDKVFMGVDSMGNLASLKELEDARKEKIVAEVGQRAKAIKSFYRMITSTLIIKDIPFVSINHTYETLEMYSKQVVSGGTGSMYAGNNVWIIGRQQDKEGKEIKGYDFIINVEKSRFVKEKSKIPIRVSYEDGIDPKSGLFELAIEAGIIKQNGAWYTVENVYDKNVRKDEILSNDEFWVDLLENTNFPQFIAKKYKLGD